MNPACVGCGQTIFERDVMDELTHTATRGAARASVQGADEKKNNTSGNRWVSDTEAKDMKEMNFSLEGLFGIHNQLFPNCHRAHSSMAYI
jgi:hypothetical protein